MRAKSELSWRESDHASMPTWSSMKRSYTFSFMPMRTLARCCSHSLSPNSRQDNSLFARMALQLHRDGEPILTRREPFPGDPAVYRTQSIEKFSFFFKLPVSQWPFQIQLPETTMDMLNDMGLPTFCDWDFCPEWGNYRDDGPKLTSPSQCGFADPTQR